MRVAIIPARGSSARVPRKNIRAFANWPMLTYPLRTAKESKLFDLLVVSTDDDEIAQWAFRFGATVVPRPHDDGTTGTQEIAARVLDELSMVGGMTCVIYPCTPLLNPEQLKRGQDALLTPANINKSFAVSVGPDGVDAGCFYFGWTLAFRDRRPLDDFTAAKVVLPAERCIDINTVDDWVRAESMYHALGGHHEDH